MKKGLIFVTLAFFLAIPSAFAQKLGYVDTEFITGKMPEYQKALAEIDRFAEKWSKDIQDKYVEIEKLQKAYQAEEILLTEDMKRERLRVIAEKEREAREYNNRVFGYEGLLFQKKKEQIKPVMELVNRAIEKVAAQKKLDLIFDKASDSVALLFTNPRHDYTDYVLEEMGLSAEQKTGRATAQTATEPVVPAESKPKASTKSSQKPK